MTSNAVRHEGSGGNNGGGRACVAAVSQHHGASPGEGEGRRWRRPQIRRAMTGGVPATMSAARDTVPLPEGVRAAGDVGPKSGSGDNGNDSRKACTHVGHAQHVTSPRLVEGRW